MPLNDTQIKTRHGLIMQGVAAEAFSRAGYSFAADVQYDDTCERPDFLIPNSSSPKFMVEVHQTDTRDSLRMKILRAFTAAMEAKAHFGPALVTANLIFGDVDGDFSASPLSALGAIYDVNILPARIPSAQKHLLALEKESLRLAKEEDISCQKAIAALTKDCATHVQAFARLLNSSLADAVARKDLTPLWKMEVERLKGLGQPPAAGPPTYYKRMMLAALFFSDSDFNALVEAAPKNEWPSDLWQQLSGVALGTITEELDGDHLEIKPEFLTFLTDPQSPRLRDLCRRILDTVPEMRWYFEDIRVKKRRERMVSLFLDALRKGRKHFAEQFAQNVLAETFSGIAHTRAWFCDLTGALSGKGFNYFNRTIRSHQRYPLNLWSPFNNLALKWSAHEKNETYVATVSEIIADIVFDECPVDSLPSSIGDDLQRGLLEFRVRSAIKLRKLNPMTIVVASSIAGLGLAIERPTIDNLLSDLAGDAGVGRSLVFSVSDHATGKRVLLNAVAVHDNNGDHKSKEWGARRLATLYRIDTKGVRKSEYQEAIFVIDGEWKDKDVARLYRSGWNFVVRLGDLEAVLRKVFVIKGKAKTTTAALIPFPSMEDESLPLAAEDDNPKPLDED